MPIYRAFRTAALIATMAVTSAGAGTIGEGGGPIQAMDLIETPPTYGSCPPPVSTMSALIPGYPTTTLTVRNRTISTQSQDALILRVVDEGKIRMFWVPIDLRPGSMTNVAIDFVQAVDSSEVLLCGDHPVGIVDDPNPVATVRIDDPVEY